MCVWGGGRTCPPAPRQWRLWSIRRGSRIFERGEGAGADTGFFTSTPPPLDIVRVTSSGVHLRSTSKKGGPTLGPMLKNLHRGPKGGGSRPPGSTTEYNLLAPMEYISLHAGVCTTLAPTFGTRPVNKTCRSHQAAWSRRSRWKRRLVCM